MKNETGLDEVFRWLLAGRERSLPVRLGLILAPIAVAVAGLAKLVALVWALIH